MNSAPTDDFDLLEAWRQGDRRAGIELFDRHYAAVSRFFRNKLHAEFEDLVQTTFLKCVESRDRFEGRSSFRTFLFGVANNVLRTAYGKRRREGERFEPAVQSAHDLAPRASTLLGQRAEYELLLQGLRRLALEDQVILELYFWENCTAIEISEALSMPEGTVRTRIRRARLRLKELISELHAGELEIHRTVSDLEDWVRQVRGELAGARPDS